MVKKFFLLVSGLAGITVLGVAALVYWFIVVQPGDSIRQENLDKVLTVESPVFYNDGKSKLGVFFQDAHRQYLPYQQIPQNFVKAIVAAEDHNFFEHHGIDFMGVARAMAVNLKAGRVVQGGSTITQQAAKNLFKRKNRSLQEKLKELLYAWRLEYHFSKEKILEFYINQFYVSGNGRGLGVAAKYYFDKTARDLTLLESAFIAGSVKRPNYYNPFIKRDAASAGKARTRALERTRYVLEQMFRMKMITAEAYQEVVGQEIPFQQGKMSYALNTVMDMVKEALAEPEVEEAFVAHGIENIATSGIRVVTTIEQNLQEYGLAALRKELSRLSVRLMGYDQRQLQQSYKKLAQTRRMTDNNQVFFGRVIAIDMGEQPSLLVSLGETMKNGAPLEIRGLIDETGLMEMVSSLIKFERQRWTEPERKDIYRFLAEFQVGDLVYVSSRGESELSGTYLLDLEKYPDLQGGIIALKNGAIRAMLGGSENRFFNRAVDARRLMGSVSKPILYTAAMQLGWSSADFLNNERDAFVYHNQVYFPRPDHVSPYQWVSMNWAGVKSENVASVWLLHNLCERLSPGQFKSLVASLHLARTENESYQQYLARIRDEHGIIINSHAVRQLAFSRAVEIISPDLLFAGKVEEHELLQRFHYRLDVTLEEEDTSREAEIRREILKRSFVRVQKIYRQLRLYQRLVRDSEERDPFGGGTGEDVFEALAAALYERDGALAFFEEPPLEGWRQLSLPEAASVAESGSKYSWESVLLDGQLSVETFRQLLETVGLEYKRLAGLPAYGPEVLYQMKDFRVLVGLRYLISLCREMGIRSDLEPVLSFPLGSNVITLLEVAQAYDAMITGAATRTGREGAGEGLMLIDRIEDSDGTVIYQPKRLKKPVVDPKTALAVTDILRHVVQYGTGRYAAMNVRLHSDDPAREALLAELDLQVPVLGKTGTANQFRNSAFAGYVPGLAAGGGGFSLADGYVLTVYEGFDDNLSMVRSSSHITGSSGALQLWTELVNFIVADNQYADTIDLDELSFSARLEIPLEYPELGQAVISRDMEKNVTVAAEGLTPLGTELGRENAKMGADVIVFGKISSEAELQPEREYKPFWGVQ